MGERLCKQAHCETDEFSSELCCGYTGGYCMFNRRDPKIDFSKCPRADLVTREDWEKHAKDMNW